MRLLGELLRPRIYMARPAEIAAAKEPTNTIPFLPDNTDIVIFYGPHDDKKDFADIVPHLAGIDIYVPEIPAWTLDQVELLSRIARGDKNARKQLEKQHSKGKFNSFADAETKTLLGTGMRVTVIDYPAEDERASEILNHFENWGLLNKVVPSWNRTLDNIINYARREANLEEYREDINVRSIGPRLQTLIDSDPELNQKDRVRILVRQGAAHAYVYGKLETMAGEAQNTTITKLGAQESFTHFDQLAHTFRTNTQFSSQVRRELATRALARVALRFNLIPLEIIDSDYHNGRLVMPSPEEMVERFSVDSIKKFHQQIVEKGQKTKT